MGVEQNCMSNEQHFVCQKKQLHRRWTCAIAKSTAGGWKGSNL